MFPKPESESELDNLHKAPSKDLQLWAQDIQLLRKTTCGSSHVYMSPSSGKTLQVKNDVTNVTNSLYVGQYWSFTSAVSIVLLKLRKACDAK